MDTKLFEILMKLSEMRGVNNHSANGCKLMGEMIDSLRVQVQELRDLIR